LEGDFSLEFHTQPLTDKYNHTVFRVSNKSGCAATIEISGLNSLNLHNMLAPATSMGSASMFNGSLPMDGYTMAVSGCGHKPQEIIMDGKNLYEITLRPAGGSNANTGLSSNDRPAEGEGYGNAIDAEIDKIARGPHQDLPHPTESAVGPGQETGWSIENATGYELHLYVSGPARHSYVIPQGGSIAITLPPGNYRIAADVSASSVVPFYAVRQLMPSTRWSSHFYIARK
jgi:hypothetical protein